MKKNQEEEKPNIDEDYADNNIAPEEDVDLVDRP